MIEAALIGVIAWTASKIVENKMGRDHNDKIKAIKDEAKRKTS